MPGTEVACGASRWFPLPGDIGLFAPDKQVKQVKQDKQDKIGARTASTNVIEQVVIALRGSCAVYQTDAAYGGPSVLKSRRCQKATMGGGRKPCCPASLRSSMR
eukprot:552338-Rhodomonas_salina.2